MKLLLLSLAAMAAAVPEPNHSNIVARDDGTPESQVFQGGVFWNDPAKSVSAVSAKMQVPNLQFFQGQPTQSVGAWVGIWGSECGFESGLLQAGIEGTVTQNSQSWIAFYEWPPAAPFTMNVGVNAGDEVAFQVVATSPTTGTVTVTNVKTGQSDSQQISGQQLCQAKAEWVVEDLAVADGYGNEELANFGTVTMTDALAISQNAFHNADEGHVVNMVQNGRSRVNVGKQGSQVTVQYAGR